MNIRVPNFFYNYKTYIGTVVSGILLWRTIKLSGITWQTLNLSGYSLVLLLASCIVFIATVVLQGHRTRLIWVANGKKYRSIHSLPSLVIGYFYNSILPGNAGEAVRAWHFSKRNTVPFQKSLAAIAVEKFVDAQLFVPIVVGLNFYMPKNGNNKVVFLLSIVVGAILCADFFIAAIILNKTFKHCVWFCMPSLHFKKYSFRLFGYFKQQIQLLIQTRLIWWYALLGYVMFLLGVVQYGLIIKASGLPAIYTDAYSLTTIGCMMVVVGVIPSAPSNLGVVHYGVYNALFNMAIMVGAQPGSSQLQQFALAATLVHVSYFIPEIVIGLIYLVKERNYF